MPLGILVSLQQLVISKFRSEAASLNLFGNSFKHLQPYNLNVCKLYNLAIDLGSTFTSPLNKRSKYLKFNN